MEKFYFDIFIKNRFEEKKFNFSIKDTDGFNAVCNLYEAINICRPKYCKEIDMGFSKGDYSITISPIYDKKGLMIWFDDKIMGDIRNYFDFCKRKFLFIKRYRDYSYHGNVVYTNFPIEKIKTTEYIDNFNMKFNKQIKVYTFYEKKGRKKDNLKKYINLIKNKLICLGFLSN